MPITITVQLLNGEQFTYLARPVRGKARWLTHLPNIELMAYERIEASFNEYSLRYIFENEEEEVITLYRARHPHASEEEVQAGATRILEQGGEHEYYRYINQCRYLTEDVTVHVIAEQREKTIDQLLAEWEEYKLSNNH